jgi:membrane-associated phospholipid phosphatase
MRSADLIRTAAWGVVAAGVAAPLVRRRLRLRAPVVLPAAGAAPVALCVAVLRSHTRDVAVCVAQMWAYVAGYKMPHDDPEALARRVRVDYPVRIDRVLGLGTLPTVRLQRLLGTPEIVRPRDAVLIWAHWVWFLVPHGTLAYLLWRRRERFPRAAALLYTVFDLGLIGYWALPTAPPWYAAREGRCDPELRRLMVEHGEAFWKDAWGPLYGSLAGNPLAAMPSLHFATSIMAAHLLGETGRAEGAVGWTYALTLGFALVYLGEHYVVDLLAGLALVEGVRRGAPLVEGHAAAFARAISRLEARAHGDRA